MREAAGLFDVSHMGEFFFEGPGAVEALDRLITNRFASLPDGRAVYAGLCAEDGTFVDDVVAYRLSPERAMLCVNAANRAADWAHCQAHHAGEAQLRDESDAWAQLAVQGPKARALVEGLCAPADAETLRGLRRFALCEAPVAGVPCLVARTGYTGEDGYELFCPADQAPTLWEAALEAGATPCGLAARDSLRLEAALALYGNDIDAEHTPYDAGLGWIVKLDKGEFVGRAALQAASERPPRERLVGFTLEGKGIPRAGMAVLDATGAPVGRVTSGTRSPTLQQALGLAYVPPALAEPGSPLQIDVRGRAVPAAVVPTPFLKKSP